jgi:single-stranded DNA-binding protein
MQGKDNMGSLTVSGIVRITRDSEVRKTDKGNWFTFGVAAFRKNSKEGKQAVDFFDADLYMKEYKPGQERLFCKGRLLYIENGYLRNDQFKGTDGKDKNRVKLMINAFELLNDAIETSKVVPEETLKPLDIKKPVDAVSKIELPTKTSTHPSDLPPPMMYNKKSDLDTAGRQYFDSLKKQEEIVAIPEDDGEEIPF